ncbi:MAG: septum formation protein Maf [Saprospiraceae bacterium]|nr:septum formation protein Maf [Saprospiraceae bacterium]
MDNFSKLNIVLGSKSPRRQQLMSEAGFNFVIRVKDTDESFDSDTDSYLVASLLAERKADALMNEINADEILLTADSVVVLDNIIYGKPENDSEAIRILKNLSGRTHTVVTGVCIMTHHTKVVFDDRTDVTFDNINDEEIAFYLSNYYPFDKAGSYGIQDWLGLCKVTAIQGSYTNVMGLPMQRVYQELSQFL